MKIAIDAKTLPQYLWLPIKPIFPTLRNIFVRAGLVTPLTMGRHRFPLGFLKTNFSPKEFRTLLCGRGFFLQPMAFTDPDQVLSLRRLDPENFNFQYHIRLYKDGEIRGHYEKTPEDHPLDHLREVGFEARYEEFIKMLAGILDETKVISLVDLSTPETPSHTTPMQYHEPCPEAETNANQ